VSQPVTGCGGVTVRGQHDDWRVRITCEPFSHDEPVYAHRRHRHRDSRCPILLLAGHQPHTSLPRQLIDSWAPMQLKKQRQHVLNVRHVNGTYLRQVVDQTLGGDRSNLLDLDITHLVEGSIQLDTGGVRTSRGRDRQHGYEFRGRESVTADHE
jgi:hypothetical protein